MKTLILGGARSGKSAWAERQAEAHGLPVTVIATARADDPEMAERIARHRALRPAHWLCVEEPLALGTALAQHVRPGRVVVVDCLTLWLCNLLFEGGVTYPESGVVQAPELLVRRREHLLQTLAALQGELYLVSNETGLGIVPLGAGTRLFVDEAGRLNQQLAQLCDRAVFMAAGLPLLLKGTLP